MKKGVSLERALSKLGYMSRSIARKIIIQGKVSVNSKIITDPSFRVDLKRDKIASMELTSPKSGLKLERIVHPSHIPINNEI